MAKVIGRIQVYYDILLENAEIDQKQRAAYTWEQFIVETQLTLPYFIQIFVR